MESITAARPQNFTALGQEIANAKTGIVSEDLNAAKDLSSLPTRCTGPSARKKGGPQDEKI